MPLEFVTHDLGGGGPVLLFLHANGFHGHAYDPMLDTLRPHFHCLGLDLPGHGKSPAPTEPFTPHTLAEALHTFLTSKGLLGCYAFCHSWGGALALLAEAAHPGTFRALYLYEPVLAPINGLPPPPDGKPTVNNILGPMTRKRQANFASVQAAATSLQAKPPFSTFHPEALTAYLGHGTRPRGDASPGVELCCAPETEARVFESTSPMAWADWGQVACPVTVAVGQENDGLHGWMSRVAPVIASQLGKGRLDRFESLQHLGPMMDPPLVAGQVLHFFLRVQQGVMDRTPGLIRSKL